MSYIIIIRYNLVVNHNVFTFYWSKDKYVYFVQLYFSTSLEESRLLNCAVEATEQAIRSLFYLFLFQIKM